MLILLILALLIAVRFLFIAEIGLGVFVVFIAVIGRFIWG
jgi:hypothetical protein